ncbi:hypothetical protein [Nocardia shimofusensis]|uniref:hypothetical protein n=1 Tax=Nocardia shimofusensis TaxID=228596 RepID=UPI00082D5812|nr:hypothetical protein [Nocardia shimofusensis]
MNTIQVLTLLLALSLALNLGFVVAWLAMACGQTAPAATLIALGVVISALGVYFAALAAYR